MAYNFTKLSDVTLIESAVEPNILIEDEGDIKKISASNIAVPQVRADWNEDDATSSAFILNKPDLSEVGGGANVITYTINSSKLMLDGTATTAQAVVDEWNNGSILRIDATGTSSSSAGSVLGIYYTFASGAVARATVSYFLSTSIQTITI